MTTIFSGNRLIGSALLTLLTAIAAAIICGTPASKAAATPLAQATPCGQPGLLIADTNPISYPYNANSLRQIDNMVEYSHSQSHLGPTGKFALFQAHQPYVERGYAPYVAQSIAAHGYTYTTFAPSALQNFNFSNYRVVLLLWDAHLVSEFVTPYHAAFAALRDYISAGGVVWIQAGFWNGAGNAFQMPFGGGVSYNLASGDTLANVVNPITASLQNPYVGNYASHGWFSGLPSGAVTLITEANVPSHITAYEYRPAVNCTPPTGTATVTGTPPTSTPTRTPINTPVPPPGVWCVDPAERDISPPCTGTSGKAIRDLQTAILFARPGDEIRMAVGAYYGAGDAVGVIDKALKITGGYPGGAGGWDTPNSQSTTVVDGQLNRASFKVLPGVTVSLNNILVVNGGISNAGTVTVDYRNLGFGGRGTVSGNYVVTTTSLLDFGGIYTVADGATMGGPGAVKVSYFQTSFEIAGAVSIRNLNFLSGKIGGAGTLTVLNRFNWTGGVMADAGITNIPPGATLNMDDSTDFIQLDRRTLNNDGTALWASDGIFYLYNGATFNNEGLFEQHSNFGLGGAGAFNNNATYRKPAAYGDLWITNNGISFNNRSVIDIPSGILTFSSRFNMLAGSRFTGAGFPQVAGIFAEFNVAGPTTAQNFNLYSGVMTGTATITVTGVFSWTGGRMAGTGATNIPATAQLNITASSGYIQLDRRTLNNNGAAKWTNPAQFYLYNNGTFKNNSLFEVQQNLGMGGSGTLDNSGTLRKLPAAYLNGNTGATLRNAGALELHGGTMTVNDFVNAAGAVLLDGASVNANYPFDLGGGMLTGTGRLYGQLTNSGGVAPGASPGIITTTTYTQYPTGTLDIELGGPNPGSGHDQVRVTGAASLGGTLNLVLSNGYNPAVGASFVIMTYGSHTGTFATLNCAGRAFAIAYNPTNITVTVIGPGSSCGAPPTATITMTPTRSATATATRTRTATLTPTRTKTPTRTSTRTLTPTRTRTFTVTPTRTRTATLTRTPAACASFGDVPQGSPFYPYISCLVGNGIISGYADCTFRPNNDVTRGQLAKIIALAANYTDAPGTQLFADVAPGSTFYDFIQRLAHRGVIAGYADGTFRPNNNATRGQIAKIVSNAANYADTPGDQLFEDVAPGSPFYDFVQRLAHRGIISGYNCGGPGEQCNPPANRLYFRPNNNATRGQVSKIVAISFLPSCPVAQSE